MNHPTHGKHLLLLLPALFVAAGAARAAGDGYEISATLLHEGSPFATPMMIVRPGERAEVKVSGADPYTFGLRASPVAGDAVLIDADIESARGSMQPQVVVRIGEAASITAGTLELAFVVQRHVAGDPP